MTDAPNDWQLNCTSIKQRGSQIMQSGQWSDCTFLVGTEPHQVSLPGHKLVLAMASPVFDAMFYGGMTETNDPISIPDVPPYAFKALLEYIYTDNISIRSIRKAGELCYAAKKYMLPHLVKKCTRYMWTNVNPKNACWAYEFARLFEEEALMERCLEIISINTKEVLNDCSFEKVELNTVITVFSLDNLNIDSELDLFDAAVRYAKAQERRQEVTTVSSQTAILSQTQPQVLTIDISAENSPEAAPPPSKRRKKSKTETAELEVSKPVAEDTPTIRSAVEKIRFLTLTPQQFANGPARSFLLSESEVLAVLMNIALGSTDAVAMPRGFSTSKKSRC